MLQEVLLIFSQRFFLKNSSRPPIVSINFNQFVLPCLVFSLVFQVYADNYHCHFNKNMCNVKKAGS